VDSTISPCGTVPKSQTNTPPRRQGAKKNKNKIEPQRKREERE